MPPHSSSPAEIEFWYAVGSTYTYLSIMRLGEVAARIGVRFRWRPFNVREIMLEMNNVPFSTKPVKAAYMWRDIERRAAMYGLPYSGKPAYPPADVERANRVALLAAREGWVERHGRAAYRHWFHSRKDPSSDEGIAAVCDELALDAARVIAAADSDALKEELAGETQVARSHGIFGSPSWVVGGELFWGDDRLEDAIAWARRGTLAPA